MQRSCNSCGMVMDGSCSHPRCPGRKSTAVVPHFDTSPSDEIETLRKRVAESDKTSDEHLNARYLAERRAEKAEARIAELEAHKDAGWDQQRYWSERYENLTVRLQKAEAALTEARARLKAADRMAYWLDKLHECGSGQIAEVSQLLYEWETGHGE